MSHAADVLRRWFDRELCPEPCGMMHTRCKACGAPVDHCPFEDTPLSRVLAEVGHELIRAQDQHSPMASPHEGWAVIYEELDELWDEVRPDRGRTPDARHEAIQTAAMAVRYILDLCDRQVGES